MKQRVRVLIADHEAHTRGGLQALLSAWPQIEVVGAATNGAETIQLVEDYRPDVVLVDIPTLVAGKRADRERDGLEAIRLIKSRWPQIRLVVLTMYATHQAAALAAGADAFLLKGCLAQDLLEAITSITYQEHKNDGGE